MQTEKAPACPVFGRCGGCTLLNLSYEEQLSRKEKEIRRLFGTLLREARIRPDPIVPSENLHYRCKVQMSFANRDERHLLCGNFMPNSHRLVPVEECLLDHELADRIIAGVKKLSVEFRLHAYDEKRKTGVIRHVMVRVGYATGEVMVILVTGSEVFPGRQNFVKALRKAFPMITTVVQNVNGAFTSKVLSDRFRTIYGPGFIYDEMLGKRFRLSPGAFYQVNPPQAERLYARAIELAAAGGGESLLDAYCGTGTIGILASAHFQNVTGVELNAAAVEDAKVNARLNGVENASFFRGDAGEFLKASKTCPDVVILDPPRSGSSPAFLNALGKAGPKTVVYVSCGPDTQVRDIRTLKKYGYELKKVCPFDLFPWTEHVETVVLLSKGRWTSSGRPFSADRSGAETISSQNVRVEFSLEDMDMSRFQQGATYEQIQEWVQEKYGFHVTHLNIAQVKRKHGIIERENYNKPKSEDSRQPGCPEEKRKAIEEALKSFQMI